MKYHFLVIFLSLFFGSQISAQSPSFKTFSNAVICGDHPDPTIFQKDGHFYTSGSSFNTSPQIFHSTDLVRWEAIARPVPENWSLWRAYSGGGAWGGCITYFYNSWWDYFCCGSRMYYTKASNPAGPWSTPVLVNPPALATDLGYDNSVFVDDDAAGTPYLLIKAGKQVNKIVKLGTNGQPTGDVIDLSWMNPSPTFPYSWAEGPVMCKKDGNYFYFIARDVGGGEAAFGAQSLSPNSADWFALGDCNSSVDATKSYYRTPNHNSHPIKLADGTWWALTQSYHNDNWGGQGRQGLLVQVLWDPLTGYPKLNAPVYYAMPAPKLSSSGIPWMSPKSDYFKTSTLHPEWQFFGTTNSTQYSLTARPGWLRINPADTTKEVIKNDGEHSYTLITKVDFNATAVGQEAGLRIVNGLDKTALVDATVYSSFNGGKKVVGVGFLTTRIEIANTIGNVLWLKMARVEHQITGYVSADNVNWTTIGTVDVSSLDKGSANYNGWIGNKQGLYARRKSADFDMYIYRDAFTPIRASNPTNLNGVLKIQTSTQYVLNEIHNNDWAMYSAVDFGNDEYKKTATKLAVKANAYTNGGVVEAWLDSIDTGKLISTCNIVNSAGAFQVSNAAVSAVTGVHDVYFRFKGTGTNPLFQVESFTFIDENATDVSAIKSNKDLSAYVKGNDIIINELFPGEMLSLYDVSGRLINTYKISDETLRISDLPASAYIVKVNGKMQQSKMLLVCGN